MSRVTSLLIGAAAVCGASFPLWAQVTTSITRSYVSPPVGLGTSETASITLVNVASSTAVEPAPSCTGTISFLNPTGAIGTSTPFMLGPEQFMTVTLPFASAGLSGIRGQIQGAVSLTISTSTPAPCSLAFSLETYDSATGATHAVLSNWLAIAGPVGPIVPVVTPTGVR
jgi:hypothetical protein